ncbi:MAG TPA: prepilin-type N-terminal cleavage/methylation domain-containing protein [bacterium]|jgi:prepilin-type N-terminal cleavage/methylation domain-containing protein|nr:prepilin-type N-terminal cleavage/methylation domain-containing protein [bacterium]HNZ51640.1 prepilin-type N-terminal cleavage/methylation domain-containing protein [bacterium]HOF79805.1 prepilin-type N-terminal cleavage/methylation domain-containing protein [bacterium]HOH85646.1 prepilin-type N-terminal cleavage/methylation domain-containing protein [bacterium]HOQ91938.1 prepilin-type N-terminal cleavage/methylation domain-containing protein [bacterium]
MNKQNNKTTKPAFSLIELLVSMAMVGVGLVGVASLAAQNIRVQYVNRNSLISAQLAQEGLELARNRRDNNWKSTSPATSLDDIYDPGFIIDYTPDSYRSGYSDIAETDPLRINGDGFYSYSGETITPFRRFLTSECQTDETIQAEYCLIRCFVSWQGKGQTGTYQAQDFIYSWYD